MKTRTTHTLAIAEVPVSCWDEIAKILKEAGYQNAFYTDDEGQVIDMNGIGLRCKKEEREGEWEKAVNEEWEKELEIIRHGKRR